MSDTQPLLLFKGEAHKITVETPSQMGDSFFKEVYQKAMACLVDIHRDNGRHKTDSNEPDSRYLPEFNNLIAFCGERGSGKSSTMISFRNLLRGWGDRSEREKPHGYEIGKEFLVGETLASDEQSLFSKDTKFLCIDAVDPSRFEPSDRLIGSILAELYRRYQQFAKSGTNEGDFERQRNLEAAFSKALKGVQMLGQKGGNPFGTPGEAENDFEILKRASDAASMRDHFHGLVQSFLQYRYQAGKELKDHYLVIPIDDLDMSVHHAFQLAEDIRKYLMVPNVVILVAMKLDQLRMAVEQANVGKFKDYRDATSPKRPSMDEIEEMSNLYLEKLVPISRVILMPSSGTISVAKNSFLYFGKKEHGKKPFEYEPNGKIEEVVLWKIKETTSICFIPKEGVVHPIVPRTLRELHNFLEFLDELGKEVDQLKRIQNFQGYFFAQWVPANLGREDEQTIQQIHATQIVHRKLLIIIELRKQINKMYVKSRNQWAMDFDKRPSALSGSHFDFDKLPGMRFMGLDTNPSNISLGDLLWHLRVYGEVDIEETRAFYLFAIRTLITIDFLLSSNELALQMQVQALIGGAVFGLGFAPLYTLPYVATTPNQNTTQSRFAFPVEEKIPVNQRFLNQIIDFLWGKVSDTTRPINKRCFENPLFARVFLAMSSFLYFGEAPIPQDKRIKGTAWYNQSANFSSGTVPTHTTFDFWSFLYWAALPKVNLSRLIDDDDDSLLVEVPIYVVEADRDSEGSLRKKIIDTLYQIEVLEKLALEIPIFIARVRKNKKKTEVDRSLWSDIVDLSDALLRYLCCLSSGLELTRKNLLEISFPILNEYRFAFWGLNENEWMILSSVFAEIQTNFLAADRNERPNNLILAENKALDKPTQKRIRIVIDISGSDAINALNYFQRLFQNYHDNPSQHDHVKQKATEFIIMFHLHLSEAEVKRINNMRDSLWDDIGNMKKRASFALEVLTMIKKLMPKKD
jgi:hypothetical protein